MFWRKKPETQGPSVASVRPADAGAGAELERALETTAELLRTLGRHAFDLPQRPAARVGQDFEQWASHLLVLSPPPAPAWEKSGDEQPSEGPRRREWRKLVRFLGAHRQEEERHVVQSTSDLRDTVLTFVKCIGRASLEDGKNARTLRSRVEQLKAAVEHNSLEELKTSALEVAQAVSSVLEEQQKRATEQTSELRDKLLRLQDQLDEANREGATDALTRLQNRRVFDTALERAVALAPVLLRPTCLLMVDVDHFKAINDRVGHPGGDRVLRAVADALARAFPRRGDLVTRYGGEEFACLLGDTPATEAPKLAARVLDAMRRLRVEHEGTEIRVTASAGFGVLGVGETGEAFVARVDRALYEAKHTGRDRAWGAAPFAG
jgi:diguanylate cyclase